MTTLIIKNHQAIAKQSNLAGYYQNFYRWTFLREYKHFHCSGMSMNRSVLLNRAKKKCHILQNRACILHSLPVFDGGR